MALQPFLRAWRQVKADGRRIRKYDWESKNVQTLVQLANEACESVGLGGRCPQLVYGTGSLVQLIHPQVASKELLCGACFYLRCCLLAWKMQWM